MNELTKPGYLDWVGPSIRAVNIIDQWIKIEVPRNVYLDRGMLAAVFEDDKDALIEFEQHELLGQKETISGHVKDPELFALLCRLYYEYTTNEIVIPQTLYLKEGIIINEP